jgi:multimeric flavodoxin WrbA
MLFFAAIIGVTVTMTKVIAINGSPRKTWNTATLLEHALSGARSVGAETELIHLYDLDFKGCTSYFACKLKGGKSYGKCAVQDGLTPLLDRIQNTDALILGSPFYFGTVTGQMRSFMERALFPYLAYTKIPSSLFGRKIRTAFIYTMNLSEQHMKDYQYTVHINENEAHLTRTFGHTESLFSFETLQFKDYSKVVFDYADPEMRKERRRTIFPKDCKKAYELGSRLVQKEA